jgi:hypothetical protein
VRAHIAAGGARLALLLPNPRGSASRARAFTERVYGDPGGAEATDTLSGIDTLVGRGVADEHPFSLAALDFGMKQAPPPRRIASLLYLRSPRFWSRPSTRKADFYLKAGPKGPLLTPWKEG